MYTKKKKEKTKRKELFNTEDYILYILNRLEPEKSDKIRLNKIAFFVEFAYVFQNERPLSNAQYAAINNGAVIDSYDLILKFMVARKKIKLDGYFVRPLKTSEALIPKEASSFIDPLIKKYSSLNKGELIGLSHSTDSFKITTNNGRTMGRIIDKDLALLETFFDEDKDEEEEIDENSLPAIDKSKLAKYEPAI